MVAELFLLRGTLKNVNTSFYDFSINGLALKRYIINFTTKGGMSWCLPPLNSITNESILNLQKIAKNIVTNYCYTFLLKQEIASYRGLGRGRRRGRDPPPCDLFLRLQNI